MGLATSIFQLVVLEAISPKVIDLDLPETIPSFTVNVFAGTPNRIAALAFINSLIMAATSRRGVYKLETEKLPPVETASTGPCVEEA